MEKKFFLLFNDFNSSKLLPSIGHLSIDINIYNKASVKETDMEFVK